jgi:uncharacterized protein
MMAYSLFAGQIRICHGPLVLAALAARRAEDDGASHLLLFNDADGGVVDLDVRGDAVDIAARYYEVASSRPRGRPKLGVVAKDVTLLPDHWAWLSSQPGGASVTLRKLVLAAMRGNHVSDSKRAAQDKTYRFLAAIAGDLPNFEIARRALFAGDTPAFTATLSHWPADISRYAHTLLADGF